MNFPKITKKYAIIQCNSEETYLSNDGVVDKILLHCPTPAMILELGCGLGRGSVLVNQRLKHLPKFYLLDGDTNLQGQVAGLNRNSSKDFYNSLDATRSFCEANGLSDFVLLDVEKDWRRDLPKFDLVFSLKSIGFHWPLSLYLRLVYSYLLDGAILAFEMRLTTRKNLALLEWIKWNFEQVESVPLDLYKIISCDFGDDPLLVLEKR